MTEPEWLDCRNPQPMMEMLRGRLSARKARLFACACCRRLWDLLARAEDLLGRDPRRWIEVAERFADSENVTTWNDESWNDAFGDTNVAASMSYCHRFDDPDFLDDMTEDQQDAFQTVESACEAASLAGTLDICWEMARALGLEERLQEGQTDRHREEAFLLATRVLDPAQAAAYQWSGFKNPDLEPFAQADLLREIVGNPFRQVFIATSWLEWSESIVSRLAETIYTDSRFEDLPILADALEEAGCTNADILDHCRGPGPHVRGCWLLDLLLGKQ